MSTRYRPGECNIGRVERRRRYAFGVAGLVATLVAAFVILSVPLPRWTALLVSVPLFGGLVGVLQGREQFCVGYAMSGVYNIAETRGDTETVDDAAAVRKDHRRAALLVGQAAGIAGAVALGFYLALGL